MTDQERNDRLDPAEAREILEDLARTGPPTARVSALRILLRLYREEQEDDDETGLSPKGKRWWATVYGEDELELLRKQRRKERERKRKKRGTPAA
jgi:hypothetical protein